nr:hypothetical protein [Tanacetum cinerariifolium]
MVHDHGNYGNGSTKPILFASILKEQTNMKTVKLFVLSNDEIVNGADVAISLVELEEVNLDDSTNNVLIPLDSWTSGLLEYKFSLSRMSLIITKLGRPIMLDAYTCNMCLKSWGHNNYAWALIEVSSKNVLVDSLVVAILILNGSGHTIETIDIEYEWQPPRCDTCNKFNHKDEQCPKQVKVAAPTKASDDGFVKVTCKHGKGKQNAKTRHIDGVWLTKPKPNYYYRHISKSANVNGEAPTSQPKEKKEPYAPRPNNKGKEVLGLHEINIVSLQNSFDALREKDKKFEVNNVT